MGVALVTLPVVNACRRTRALATVGLPGGTNQSERFNYKGEWVSA